MQETQDLPGFLEERGLSPFEFQRLSPAMRRYLVEAWQIECAIVQNRLRVPGQPVRYLPRRDPPAAQIRHRLTLRELVWMTAGASYVAVLFSMLLTGDSRQRVESFAKEPTANRIMVSTRRDPAMHRRYPGNNPRTEANVAQPPASKFRM